MQPFPGPGGKWQISTEGGTEAVWAGNGELFYRNEGRNKMMVVDITTEPTFRAGNPRLLFEGSYLGGTGNRAFYDVTPDGQRFVMVQTQQGPGAQINVVLNWFEELKRLVPTGSESPHLISYHVSTTESPEQQGKPANKKDLHD